MCREREELSEKSEVNRANEEKVAVHTHAAKLCLGAGQGTCEVSDM